MQREVIFANCIAVQCTLKNLSRLEVLVSKGVCLQPKICGCQIQRRKGEED